jgi:hypothetical protein
MPVPIHLLALPLLLVALLALLLTMVKQRRRAEAGTAAPARVVAPVSTPAAPEPAAPSSAPSAGGKGRSRKPPAGLQLSAAEEVRLLRMQVETLTEALATARAQLSGSVPLTPAVETPAPPADDVTLTFEPLTEPVAVEPEPEPDPEPMAVEPVVIEPVVIEPPAVLEVEPLLVEPIVIPHPAELDPAPEPDPLPPVVFAPMIEVEPLVAPAPAAAVPPPAPEPAPPVADESGPDHTAHAYAALSRLLAGAGRLREAALAQWAADLRVLAPLLGDRAVDLHQAMTALAPADPAAAVSGARAVASSLVDPALSGGMAVTAMLGDTSHLSGHLAGHPAGRRPYADPDVSPDLLPDDAVTALESVLLTAAADSGDTGQVSVGLRCDLVAHLVAGLETGPDGARATTADAVAVVRDVLQPHERRGFDAELERALTRSLEGPHR